MERHREDGDRPEADRLAGHRRAEAEVGGRRRGERRQVGHREAAHREDGGRRQEARHQGAGDRREAAEGTANPREATGRRAATGHRQEAMAHRLGGTGLHRAAMGRRPASTRRRRPTRCPPEGSSRQATRSRLHGSASRSDAGTILGAIIVAMLLLFVVEFVVSFAIGLLHGAVGVASSVAVGSGRQRIPQATAMPVFVGFGLVLQAVSFVLNLMVSSFFGAGIVNFSLKVAKGAPYAFGDIFAGGRFFLSVIVAQLISTFAVMVGILLLIVPGVIVALGLSMTQPLIVDRNLGPIDALTESWKLTDGSRVNIFIFGLIAVRARDCRRLRVRRRNPPRRSAALYRVRLRLPQADRPAGGTGRPSCLSTA